uniref:Uncharacterized protein n=1 Tax=Arundo donax TaxID=35708 RepID=A0A0A9HGJ7_ARUDO
MLIKLWTPLLFQVSEPKPICNSNPSLAIVPKCCQMWMDPVQKLCQLTQVHLVFHKMLIKNFITELYSMVTQFQGRDLKIKLFYLVLHNLF